MGLERAEAAREGDVLLGGDVLVAEENDLVLEQRPMDLVERLVVYRLGQGDAVDLGPDRRAQRLGRDAAIGLSLVLVVGRTQPSRPGMYLQHGGLPFVAVALISQTSARRLLDGTRPPETAPSDCTRAARANSRTRRRWRDAIMGLAPIERSRLNGERC